MAWLESQRHAGLTVVRGHVQMRDGEPCGKPIGKALKPLI